VRRRVEFELRRQRGQQRREGGQLGGCETDRAEFAAKAVAAPGQVVATRLRRRVEQREAILWQRVTRVQGGQQAAAAGADDGAQQGFVGVRFHARRTQSLARPCAQTSQRDQNSNWKASVIT